jgi:hypothetical protein
MLGKMLFTKKAHEKFSRPRAKFNGRPKLPGWPGKDGAAVILGHLGFYRRGRLRKLGHALVVSGRVGLF